MAMLNAFAPIFTAEEVMKIANISRTTLANWLRRGLVDRLNSEKVAGKHRRYTAADVLTIAAMAKLCGLGLKPGAFEDRLASLILSNAMHRYAAKNGVWGESAHPDFENQARWLVVFHNPATGERDWTDLPRLEILAAMGHSALLLIDCHQISDYVMEELEALVFNRK